MQNAEQKARRNYCKVPMVYRLPLKYDYQTHRLYTLICIRKPAVKELIPTCSLFLFSISSCKSNNENAYSFKLPSQSSRIVLASSILRKSCFSESIHKIGMLIFNNLFVINASVLSKYSLSIICSFFRPRS